MSHQLFDQDRANLARTYFGRTPWPAELDPLLRTRPLLLEAYLKLAAVPWQTDHLSPRMRELIYVGIDAVPNQFYPEGIRLHADSAYRAGATHDDVLSSLSISALVVFEATISAFDGVLSSPKAPFEDTNDVLQRGVAARGAWDERLNIVLAHAPDLASAWVEVLEVTFGTSCSLNSVERELVYLACLAAAGVDPQTLALPITLAHTRGATIEMVVETISLVAPLGLHALAKSVPEGVLIA
jgi:alkylhydroperoxidase/carboxymuconolactone decarboxylase family protein YurZ